MGDFSVQYTVPLSLLFLLSSCLPLTEVVTEPVCVATISDEPPTQAWGSPQPMWFLWQQPNTPELLVPSGLWYNSQFYAVALFSVGWLLTSLSPPSVYSQEIWPSPSRGESWHLQRIASCCLSCSRSQDHLPSLLPTHVAKMKGFSALGILLWVWSCLNQDEAICQVICPDKHVLFTGCISSALTGPIGEIV